MSQHKFKVGEWCRYVLHEYGNIHFVGKVVKVTSAHVVLDTELGIFTCKFSEGVATLTENPYQ